jgi:hypothetical protein
MDVGPGGASFHDLDSYVVALQGTRAIKKILIANNGIAAVKAIRFIRKWSYEVFGSEHEVGARRLRLPLLATVRPPDDHLACGSGGVCGRFTRRVCDGCVLRPRRAWGVRGGAVPSV